MRQAPATKRATGGPKDSTRRDELLKIAAEVFARKGYAEPAPSETSPTRRAFSPGSLYHHFESKDSILDALLRHLFTELLDSYRVVVEAELPVTETFRQLLRTGFGLLVKWPAEIRAAQRLLRTWPSSRDSRSSTSGVRNSSRCGAAC